jgi:hypothetical protein
MLDLLFQQAVDWRIKPSGLLAPENTMQSAPPRLMASKQKSIAAKFCWFTDVYY